MLKIENFTKKYGEKVAVDNLSLEINPGELYGFIGHNGAGKTTTLKAVSGIMSFDQGEIYVCGHSIKKEPIKCKENIAYLPDNPDLYNFLTGIQYLNFVADIFGMGKERQEEIEKYAVMLKMEDDLYGKIGGYSHGMKQKLAVISALIHKPKLIIMDEPFVGLDPLAAHQLKDVMARHCIDGGAIFFSTHVLEVAQKLCHKVAIIKQGKLVANGTMEEISGDSSLEEVFLELEGNKEAEEH